MEPTRIQEALEKIRKEGRAGYPGVDPTDYVAYLLRLVEEYREEVLYLSSLDEYGVSKTLTEENIKNIDAEVQARMSEKK